MSLFDKVLSTINQFFGIFGMCLVKKAELDRCRRLSRRYFQPSYNPSSLPEGAENYLRTDNPRLKELKRQYVRMESSVVDHSQWSDDFVRRELNLKCFRGDNPFIYQYRDKNEEANYVLTTYYLRSIDRLALLDKISEDGYFGAYTFLVNGNLIVSRDLLDSILEINFLEETLGLSNLEAVSVLDIGAGYGRLAHRLVEGLSNVDKVYCVDAVAESTFICEYYLSFRGVYRKAITVPGYEVESFLESRRIEIATNIHSFSECSLAAIRWWLDLLKEYAIRYLFVVPNPDHHGGTCLLSTEKDWSRKDFFPELEVRGYRLIAKQPKYRDSSVQRFGVTPTHFHLFELEGS